MRINTDRNTMDMEARDISYFLQAYLLQYLFASKAEDPTKIIIPMFPSVPHPRKPRVQIPIKWVEPDSPIAVEIAKDGSNIPEATVEEAPKEPEEEVAEEPTPAPEDIIRQEEEANPPEEQSEPVTEQEEISPAKAALEKLKGEKRDSSLLEGTTALKDWQKEHPPEEREPKQPPSGDIGTGHPDDMSSRDVGFDRKIAAALRPEAQVDESKEIETDIDKPKEQ